MSSAAHELSGTNRDLDASAPITLKSTGVTPTPTPTPTPEPTTPPTTPPVVGTGTFNWGFAAKFIDYIEGPIAEGKIAVSGAAKRTGSTFSFAQGATTVDPKTGLGVTEYHGGVRFTGHNGILDVYVADPIVSALSANSATVEVLMNGKRTVLGTINLTSATASNKDGVLTWANAPIRVSAATTEILFNGREYTAAELSAVTFSVGTPSTTLPTTPPKPTNPTTPPKPTTPSTPGGSTGTSKPATVGNGSLSWGIKSQYLTYIQGPIAKGSVSVSGGATMSGGIFRFGQTSSAPFSAQTNTGSVSYAGAVRFFGHNGALDITLNNPQIIVATASRGMLTASVNGTRMVIGTINLAAANRSNSGGAYTWSNAPVSLTGQAAEALFLGRYSTIDPVTFTIGAPAAAPAGSTGTVIAASSASKNATTAIPATPPATTGIELDADTLAALGRGEVVSVSAGGFVPNETGIRVIVYSSPILIDTITADSDGVATWTGSLPKTLAAGNHTLTFQGSQNVGIVVPVVTPAVLPGCVVSSGTLNWGFKAAFLNYIETIARGEYLATNGATFEYPAFHFGQGSGAYDVEKASGIVAFPGTVNFTGHAGVLNTTISNPQIEFVDASTAFLLLDISGTTQDGSAVAEKGIRFAELDLTADNLSVSTRGVVGTEIPATLTETGSAAFGTYPTGEALDPVSFGLPVADDCAVASISEPTATEAQEVATDLSAEAEPTLVNNAWMYWAAGAVLVILLAAALLGMKRRRFVTTGDDTGAAA